MRVGIIGLLQESNTFVREPTTIEHFRQGLLLTGEDIPARLANAHHEISGFLQGLDETGIDAVPIFVARALPFGAMTADTYQRLLDMMLAGLSEAGPLDGVLAACHGADVSESVADVDGDWLRHIRHHVGDACPLIGTLDLHGNLSPQMVGATDALIAYRTNPHIDQRQRGLEASHLMGRTLRSEVLPTQVAVFPPLVINIERQDVAERPCAQIYAAADKQLREAGVLSNSILLGFPYADVEEMGCSAIVVTDNNPPQAERLASELGDSLWCDREAFVAKLLDVPAALDQARKLTGSVCLLDMGDNVGGGSPGDSTFLLRAIHEQQMGPAFACLYDPEAVQQAEVVPQGKSVSLQVGGKTDDRHGEPFSASFTVRGFYDGRFREQQPRHGGFTEFDQGRTVVVETDGGLTLLLNSRRMVPFSLQQLLSCEIDPTTYRLLIVKGVHAPIAAYRDVCAHFLRVNTAGVTTADLAQLEYRRRRRPLYPFEPDFEWRKR